MRTRKPRVLIIPVTDWFGGPEHRFHRIFDEELYDSFDFEVVYLPIVGTVVRHSRLKVVRMPCMQVRSRLAFFALSLVPVAVSLLIHVLRTRPDVIVSVNPIHAVLVARLGVLHKARLIFDFVDDFFGLAREYVHSLASLPIIALLKILLDQHLKYSNHVVVTSDELRKYSASVSESPISLIPNGVSLRKFANQSHAAMEPVVVGYVGGIYLWSGVIEFVNTIRELRKRIDNVEYRIYGDGDAVPELIQMISRMEGVTYCGAIPYALVPETMSGFRVGVIPFRKSYLTDAACPLKLFEYWASSVPVVSRNLAEVARVGGDAVLLYNDEADLIEALHKVLTSPGLAAELKRKGLDRVEPYDWTKIAATFGNLLHEEARTPKQHDSRSLRT